MRSRATTLLTGAVCAVACGIAASPAIAATPTHTITRSSGQVSATLTYKGSSSDSYRGMYLTIRRGGRALLAQAVVGPGCGHYCGPLGGGQTLKVGRLDGTNEPNVLVQMYSGGAHCCQVDVAYTYDAKTGRYTRATDNFGDPGALVKRIGGKVVFETADDAFAYAFTDYAASGLPIKIEQLYGGRFVNITRDYPALIASDAKTWLAAFNDQKSQHYADTVGVIAAWAADEDELGNESAVTRFLDEQAAEHHLNAALSGVPENAKFVRALEKFLKQTGYVTRTPTVAPDRA